MDSALSIHCLSVAKKGICWGSEFGDARMYHSGVNVSTNAIKPEIWLSIIFQYFKHAGISTSSTKAVQIPCLNKGAYMRPPDWSDLEAKVDPHGSCQNVWLRL